MKVNNREVYVIHLPVGASEYSLNENDITRFKVLVKKKGVSIRKYVSALIKKEIKKEIKRGLLK